MIQKILTPALFFLVASLAVSGTENVEALAKSVVANYADLAHAGYSDSLSEAQKLNESLEALCENPSEQTLQSAREAWIAARRPYLQTEVFRFYAGPIDDEDGPEGLLNAWPVDESYVDYVEGVPNAGIINDPETFPNIDKNLVVELNEKDGEENISAGFHAIEFLLWGQDRSATGPGDRPFTDFTSTRNADRRRVYLLALGDLLVENLAGLAADWAPGRDNYRKDFVSDDPMKSLQKILTGISMLSGFELSGERLLVSVESQSQEDEHSCFSDTTHTDVILDAQGIVNVWKGDYVGTGGRNVSGKGVSDIAEAADPSLAKKLNATIEEALILSKQIPVPYDQAILGEEGAPGPRAIMAVVIKLEDLAELLGQLSRKLGFEVPTSEDKD
jgi:putative iron-regulated protein